MGHLSIYQYYCTMNKTRSIIVAILAIGLLVISCKSNEEKANELIKDYMYKSLYDYDSYQ